MSNREVYEKVIQNIVLSSLEGINGTIFMYGQTGSGKTYTMLGEENMEIVAKHNNIRNNPGEISNCQSKALRKSASPFIPPSKGSRNGPSTCLSGSGSKGKGGRGQPQEGDASFGTLLNNSYMSKSSDQIFANMININKLRGDLGLHEGVLIYALNDIFTYIQQV